MGFSSIVDSAISRDSIVAARGNFGTGLIAHYHTKDPNRIIEIAGTAELITTYGFDRTVGTDAVFLAKVDQVFAQQPKPKSLKIGRRALPPTQVYTLTVQTVATGNVVSIDFEGTPCPVTVDGVTVTSASTAATALAVLINAIHAGRAAAVGAVVTVTGSAAGILYKFANWNRYIKVAATTADAGIATDLDAIRTEDDDWIALDLVDDNKAEVLAAGAWAEAQGDVMFWPTVADSICRDSGVTTDVISSLKTLAYEFTQVNWNGYNTFDARGFALFCSTAAFFNPGAATFAHKTIYATAAETKQTLRTGEISTLENKRGNFYAPYLKVPTSWSGVTCSGEWSDIVLGQLWLNAEIKARLFETIRGAPGKLSYTDEDIALLSSSLAGTLETAANDDHKLIAKDPKYTITATPVASLTSSQRATRVYSGLAWTATFQGAVHSGVVRGKVAP